MPIYLNKLELKTDLPLILAYIFMKSLQSSAQL